MERFSRPLQKQKNHFLSTSIYQKREDDLADLMLSRCAPTAVNLNRRYFLAVCSDLLGGYMTHHAIAGEVLRAMLLLIQLICTQNMRDDGGSL